MEDKNDNKPSPEEVQLMQQLKDGKEEAFDQLYKIYCLRIHLGFKDFTKTDKGADRLLEELFVKVWVNRANVVPQEPFWDFLMPLIEDVLGEFYHQRKEEKIMDNLLQSAESVLRNSEEDEQTPGDDDDEKD